MSHLGDIFRGSMRTKANKKFGRKCNVGVYVYRDCPNFLSTPLLSQKRIKLWTSNWASIFTGTIRTKSLQNFGEKGAWAYPGTAEIFWVPLIISGTGKATNFKFCTSILSIDRNRSQLQISGKVAGCVVRTLKPFQGTHILRASRGLLCHSSAVLFSNSWEIQFVFCLFMHAGKTAYTVHKWKGTFLFRINQNSALQMQSCTSDTRTHPEQPCTRTITFQWLQITHTCSLAVCSDGHLVHTEYL